MNGWKGWVAVAAALFVAFALGGCSRNEQRHAQEVTREAAGTVRRAARQAVRGTREAIGKATAAADDLALTGKVKSALLLNKRLDGAAIDVETKEGVVTLSGTALTRHQQAIAVRVARDVRGVRRVINTLQLLPTRRRPALSAPTQA